MAIAVILSAQAQFPVVKLFTRVKENINTQSTNLFHLNLYVLGEFPVER